MQCWNNKLKLVLGSQGGHAIVSYRQEIKNYIKNNINKYIIFYCNCNSIDDNVNNTNIYNNYRLKNALNLLEVTNIIDEMDQYLKVHLLFLFFF